MSEPARKTLVAGLERYALVVLLAVLIVVFAVLPATSETFFTLDNLRGIAANQAVVCIVALAALIPLIGGGFDVSVGAVLGMSSYVLASLTVEAGVSPVPAVLITLVLGAGVGAVSGVLVAYLGANSFIITLGMSTLIGGLVTLYSSNVTLLGVPESVVSFGGGRLLGVPAPVWTLAVVALVVGYLLAFTVRGRQLLQVGVNPSAARLVGIRVERVVLASFVLAGLVAAAAGCLQLTRSGSANPSLGFGFTLSALAACFLGATTIRPGRFNVPGTIVGVLFVAVSVNGLTLAGAADWVDPVFNGLSVIVAVALSTILARRRGAPGAVT